MGFFLSASAGPRPIPPRRRGGSTALIARQPPESIPHVRHRRSHCAGRQPPFRRRCAGASMRRSRIGGRTPVGSRPSARRQRPLRLTRPNSHCCTAGSPSSISIRAANQPMASADGRYVLVFNGEIYNFVELREALCARRPCLPHLLRHRGARRGLCELGREAAAARFTGMYAFVMLDRAAPRIVRGARSVRHQAAVLGARQRPSRHRLRDRSAARRARRRAQHRSRPHLPVPVGRPDRRRASAPCSPMCAACRREASRAFRSMQPAVAPVAFWRPTIAVRDRSPKAAAAELRDALIRSVELHLRSDVPTGISLSGGIDSSAIIACARAVGGPSADLRTFSFIATGSEVDETPFIEMAAQAGGCRAAHGAHRAGRDRRRHRPAHRRAGRAVRQPLHVCPAPRHGARARHGIKVILDGQGADELFAGYRPYLARRLTELLASFRLAGSDPVHARYGQAPRRRRQAGRTGARARGVAAAARSRAARGRAAAIAALDRRPMVRRQKARSPPGEDCGQARICSTMRWCRA